MRFRVTPLADRDALREMLSRVSRLADVPEDHRARSQPRHRARARPWMPRGRCKGKGQKEEGVMTILVRLVLSGLLIGALDGSSAAARQTPTVKNIMLDKLAHAQAILGAVVTSDWPTLERESRALARIAKQPKREQ